MNTHLETPEMEPTTTIEKPVELSPSSELAEAEPVANGALETPILSRMQGKPESAKPPAEKTSKEKTSPKPSRSPHGTNSSIPIVLPVTSLPPARTVVFPCQDTIICSRKQLLTMVPKTPPDNEFGVGDLVWVKVTGFPYWPCMVTLDPLLNLYSREENRGFIYHVQFFGRDPSRMWTKPGSIFRFEGYEKYKELAEGSKTPGKRGPKANVKFVIEPKHRKIWTEAVSEAECASSMEHPERIEKLTFNYTQEAPKQLHLTKLIATPITKGRRRKKKTSPESVFEFDDAEDDPDVFDGAAHALSSPLRLNGAKRRGEFSVYCEKERPVLEKLNTEMAAVEIETLLEKNWELLSEDLRAKYVVRAEVSSIPPFKIKLGKPSTPKAAKRPYVRKPKNLTELNLSEEENSLVISEPPAKRMKAGASTPVVLEVLMTPSSQLSGRPKTPGVETAVDIFVPQTLEKIRKKPGPKPGTPRAPRKTNGIAPVSSKIVFAKETNTPTESSDEAAMSVESSVSDDHDSIPDKHSHLCDKCHLVVESPGESLPCCGECLQIFHKACFPDITDAGATDWKCPACTTGEHECFLCKNHTSEVKKCSDVSCGRFYHPNCLTAQYPHKVNTGGTFTCPLHFCLTCHLDNDTSNAGKRRFVTCAECPTAYHYRDNCMAAGSTMIIQGKVVSCPEHVEKKKKLETKDKHINVNYCFGCLAGGSLVCCERCPAAFHRECIEQDLNFDEGKPFFCSGCIRRKQFHYGDVIWAKLGSYRWWPGKVVAPKDTPHNLYNLRWSKGDFPVLFFGTNDYNWVNRGRAFAFEEGDSDKPISGGGNKTAQNFKKGVEQAKQAFAEYKEWKAKLNLSKKPPPYGRIKTNVLHGKVRAQTPEKDGGDHNKCSCDPNNNPCSENSNCINRMMMFECCTSNCKVDADKCRNQRFRKREYVKAVPFNTGGRGWGLRALENISKGTFVIEYVGELIDEEECQRRLKDKSERNDNCFYFLTIDKDRIIDAGPKGNLARFMNHSCQPNCETQKWIVNGSTRVGLFAVVDIPNGTELTFNYNLDSRGNDKLRCACGAKNCSNFI